MFIHPGKVPVNLRPSGNCWIIKPLLLVASSDTVYISEAMAKEYELIVSVAFLPVILLNPRYPPGSSTVDGQSKLCQITMELFSLSLTTRFPLSRSTATAEIEAVMM
jgi:hypothetical protein